MKRYRLLKLSTLRELGACDDQCALFEQRFGAQVRVTVELCERVAPLFKWDWAARHLLPEPAWDEYERVITAALAEYERVITAAWAKYERAIAPASDEYERAIVSASDEYKRAIAPVLAEYERAKASAFARGYLSY